MSVPGQSPHQVWLPPPSAVRGLPRPHPEAETYPHLLRTYDWATAPTRMWWRPVAGALVVFVSTFVVMPLVLAMVILVPGALIEHGSAGLADYLQKLAGLEVASPTAFLYLNLSLASAILVAGLMLRWLHRMRFGWLWSVAARFRWHYFLACLGLSVVTLAVSLGLSYLVPGAAEFDGDPQPITPMIVGVIVVLLLTTPLQAIGEEFAFRGYLLMCAGSLFGWWAERSGADARRARTVGTWLAVLATALLFAAFHGSQNFPLFFDRFAFGLIAGILVVRTGGLEAGIALHALNNLVAFALAIGFGDLISTLKVTEIPWSNIPITIVTNGFYLLVALWAAKRMGVARRTSEGAGWPGEEAATIG